MAGVRTRVGLRFRGTVAEVLTTMPLRAMTLAGLRSALNNRFGIEEQSELVKVQLSE